MKYLSCQFHASLELLVKLRNIFSKIYLYSDVYLTNETTSGERCCFLVFSMFSLDYWEVLYSASVNIYYWIKGSRKWHFLEFKKILKDFKLSQRLQKQLYGINVEENKCDFVDKLSWQIRPFIFRCSHQCKKRDKLTTQCTKNDQIISQICK